uniref:TWiK family of potassium channels protein 7-like n=2 Tax=Hirondellea gigas TaxID=1518452 RepID=A0A6A7G7E2_9CRUS
MEDNSAFTYKDKKPASSVLFNLLFSHVGLFFIVAIYCTLGAMTFMELERSNEERIYKKKQESAYGVNQTVNYMAQMMWFYQAHDNWTFPVYQNKVMTDLGDLAQTIMNAMSNDKYDGTTNGWDWSWTFAKSLLLTMTIITTIGYGHISPLTFYGQMYCIIYALVGCPLLLLFLANIGDAMGNGLVYIYSRMCCRCCRAQRNLSELPPGASKRSLKLLIDDEIGKEDYMPTDKVVVPITINLVLLTGYIVTGAIMFTYWEGWALHTACYFTFITISTIGYGDYYPKSAMVEDLGVDFLESCKFLTVVLYILFGMALLAMAINLMQDQLMEKSRWVAREIGLTKDPDAEDPATAEDPESNQGMDEKPKKKKKTGKKNKKKADAEDAEAEDELAPLPPPIDMKNKRKESVADTSEPISPSDVTARPGSALSLLPGTAEE